MQDCPAYSLIRDVEAIEEIKKMMIEQMELTCKRDYTSCPVYQEKEGTRVVQELILEMRSR
jgi:hypothetical protein